MGGNLHRTGQHLLVRVAKRDHLHRRNLEQAPEIALAIPTGPNEPHLEFAIRLGAPQNNGEPEHEGAAGRGQGAVFEEFTACASGVACLCHSQFVVRLMQPQFHKPDRTGQA